MSHQVFTVTAIIMTIAAIILINTMLIRDVFHQDFTVTTMINYRVDHECELQCCKSVSFIPTALCFSQAFHVVVVTHNVELACRG